MDILSDSGWATDREFDRMKLANPVNEGWLYSEDKDSIKVFASYGTYPKNLFQSLFNVNLYRISENFTVFFKPLRARGPYPIK